jgi:Ankyrin repeats (3 copies)/Ankyrin repeat
MAMVHKKNYVDDQIRTIEQHVHPNDDDIITMVQQYLALLRELDVPPDGGYDITTTIRTTTTIVERVLFWIGELEPKAQIEAIDYLCTFGEVLIHNRHDTANGIICLQRALDRVVDIFPSLSEDDRDTAHFVLDAFQYMTEHIDIALDHFTMKDDEGYTLLHWVALLGDTYFKIAELYVENGVDIQMKDNYGQTPLHHAIIEKHLEIVQYLVENGVDMETKDDSGFTPLHHAIIEMHAEVVQYLVENGANIETKEHCGFTPLYMAILKNQYDIVSCLLKHGADTDFKNVVQSGP